VAELVYLLHPFRETVEARLVGDVVDDEYADRAAEVLAGEGVEALLAGCVPELRVDGEVLGDGDFAALQERKEEKERGGGKEICVLASEERRDVRSRGATYLELKANSVCTVLVKLVLAKSKG
jgi:hypothetical protein